MREKKQQMSPRGHTKGTVPDKALKSLANSIYKTLRDEGCQHKEIIGVSSQLISLVTSSLEADSNKK